ncbi:hypothetical protein Tco_1040590, partial [Tanacetum coccineum]
TDKVDLEEFDLKNEDAIDKEVTDKVKDHKRKHDSDDDEDDDDDEGPSAGSNQGRSAKRRRPDSAASGSAQPPPEDDDQSSKKPWESDASASKQHPALTSTGWQITDIRDAVVDSSMHKSDPESEHSEQSSDDIPIRTRKKKLCKADLEGPAFNLVKAFHKNNCGLWQSLTGGLGEREFYINKHSEPSDREAVRSQMRILSSNKNLKKDFKNLHPNDFEDLFLLNIQEKLNHLPKTDKTSLHTAVNMWIRNLDATDYYFKEDYTIVPKPRAVCYTEDRNDQRNFDEADCATQWQGDRKWLEDDKKEDRRLSSLPIEKRLYRIRGSSKVLQKKLCWRKNKRY